MEDEMISKENLITLLEQLAMFCDDKRYAVNGNIFSADPDDKNSYRVEYSLEESEKANYFHFVVKYSHNDKVVKTLDGEFLGSALTSVILKSNSLSKMITTLKNKMYRKEYVKKHPHKYTYVSKKKAATQNLE